jgi:hypothetical protein
MKIAELPESTEKIQKEATAALIESNQISSRQSSLLYLTPRKLI